MNMTNTEPVMPKNYTTKRFKDATEEHIGQPVYIITDLRGTVASAELINVLPPDKYGTKYIVKTKDEAYNLYSKAIVPIEHTEYYTNHLNNPLRINDWVEMTQPLTEKQGWVNTNEKPVPEGYKGQIVSDQGPKGYIVATLEGPGYYLPYYVLTKTDRRPVLSFDLNRKVTTKGVVGTLLHIDQEHGEYTAIIKADGKYMFVPLKECQTLIDQNLKQPN